MTVIPLRAGRQQQIPILAAGPLGGRGRVGRQPTEGGAVNFPQEDLGTIAASRISVYAYYDQMDAQPVSSWSGVLISLLRFSRWNVWVASPADEHPFSRSYRRQPELELAHRPKPAGNLAFASRQFSQVVH